MKRSQKPMKTGRVSLEEMGRLIRAVRKQRNLTQQFLADRLGISQSALSKIETAKAEPSALQWLEFCDLTGTPADVLLTGQSARLIADLSKK